MKITEAIITVLDITPTEYWDRYLIRYMDWLSKYSTDMDDFQKLLANAAINGWYTRWHEDLEIQAIEVLKPQYQTITIDKVRRIYGVMMADIFNNYPKHLFDAARKLEIINDPRNHDHTAN